MTKNLLCSFALLACLSVSTCAIAQDGILDPSFGNNGIVQTTSTQEASDMIIQPDNKIIVVGSINMGSVDMAVVRYNPDGSLDNSFGTNGIATVDFIGSNDAASSVVLQNDGKIVVAGSTQNSSNNNSDIGIIRLNSDGMLDNSFGTNGKFQLDVDGYAFDRALDLTLQNDGKLVVVAMAGTDMFAKNAVLRLNTNGTLDNSFDGDGILKAFSFGSFTLSSLYAVTIQNDGKILVAGSRNNNFAVARLNSDGSIDNTYGTSGVFSTTTAVVTQCRIILQGDGKLLATHSSATQTEALVLRLNQNGTEDSSFGTNGKVQTQVGSAATYDYTQGIVLQPDGKIIVTGSSYTSGSTSDYLTIRYNSNGTIDNSFGANSNGIVTTSVEINDEDRGKIVRLQSDGKIVVAGSSCTGSCDFVLLRYGNTNSGTGNRENSPIILNPLIYPNPAGEYFFVGNLPEGSTMIITDISGKSILQKLMSKEIISLNTTDLENGVYFIEIAYHNSLTKRKLIVSR